MTVAELSKAAARPDARTADLTVVGGAGHVGIPLVLSFAAKGLRVNVEESRMFEDQPDCAIIFSWHIADELASKLRAKGYKGMLVTPLPVPRVL